MKESWRWFGAQDPVSLSDIRQTGAQVIVTALHHIPNGEVWPQADIQSLQRHIASAGLSWEVVESVPVHEDIKTRRGDYQRYIANYQQTLKNLAACGILTVCYNFMPVLDWTRTDLTYTLPDGCQTLYFDQIDFAAFELFMLKRSDADRQYSDEEITRAEKHFAGFSEAKKAQLQANIIQGLPGAEECYTLEQFKHHLAAYDEISADGLRDNLRYFLNHVVPVAQSLGMRLVIHPDDPPRPILGLPRIVSTLDDMNRIRQMVDAPANGFTFCTGSYGVRADNTLGEMIAHHADRIHFVHLRSTKRVEGKAGSFYEANHLGGDTNMYDIVRRLLAEEQQRGSDSPIYFRPDHGYQMLDDLHKQGMNPGYSCIGRLKGLAELRGLIYGIEMSQMAKSS